MTQRGRTPGQRLAQGSGQPIPADIERLLGALIAETTVTGEVLDIYAAAGMSKPSLVDLGTDFVA